METISFANGETHDCSFLATIPDSGGMRAFIALSDVTFVEAAAIFSNTDYTAEMTYGNNLLVGYTNLLGIYQQPYGIQAILTGGHDETRQPEQD